MLCRWVVFGTVDDDYDDDDGYIEGMMMFYEREGQKFE